MELLKGKYNSFIKEKYNSEILFCSGFALFLFWSIIRTTMFPRSGIPIKICFGVSVLLMITKIILFDIYTFKMFITIAVMFFCGAIVFLSSGYFWPILWLFVVVAAKDVSFRKILQIYLLMNITIMGLAFVASLLGVIENLAYTSSETKRLRYSFGCTYTTDFAAHVFYMLLTAFYLYYERLKWYHYVVVCFIDGFVFYFCHAKLDTVCIIIMMVCFGTLQIAQSLSKKEQTAVIDITTGRRIDKLNFFKKTKLYFKHKVRWKRKNGN